MYSKVKIVILIAAILEAVLSENDAEIVGTTHGKVSGKVLKTLLKGKRYYGFMGIPFAKPPVKELRFFPPQPLDPWPDVLHATKEAPACVQFNRNLKKGQPYGFYGTEDCLYLDIYTPNPDTSKRATVVFLYNENFQLSYNKTKDYAPDFFIEEDVIVAAIPHRLAVQGFLSLQDDNLQGNAGLKDIVAGLQWIRINIDKFGGDANRITLMGSQGGAAAVDLLIHTEARKLFNSAILQSGTSFSSSYLQNGARKRAFKLVELVDRKTSANRILKELNDVPIHDLLNKENSAISQDFNKEEQKSLLPFGPIIENNGLVTQYPESSEKIDLPVMIGFNSREGLEASLQYLIDHKWLSFVEKDFVLIMPWRVSFSIDPNSNSYMDAIKDVKQFYFKKGRVTIKSVSEYITYIGDVLTASIDYTAQYYANISSEPIYYYHFDYYSDLNENKNDLLRLAETVDGTWGAATGDELCYLFKCPRLRNKYLKHNSTMSEEISMLKNMVKMWSNFVKYGNPTPDPVDVQWPSYNNSAKKYLHISRLYEVKEDLHKNRFDFWRDFVAKWEKKVTETRNKEMKNKDEL